MVTVLDIVNIDSIKMPAGRYWVGDPCYSVPDGRWDEWLKGADNEGQDRYLVARLDGRWVLGIRTAYGDGQYYDRAGLGSFPVDAGLIGLVPVEVANAHPDGDGAVLVEFEHDFECRWEDEDGLIVLGHIEIETDPDDDYCSGCDERPEWCLCDDPEDDPEEVY